MTRLLFVCLGNIIRSPLAENLLRFQAEEAGNPDFPNRGGVLDFQV